MFERRRGPRSPEARAKIGTIDSQAAALDRALAADMVLRHLFVPPAQPIEGIRYAAYYRFAEKHSGGDIIDVYECAEGDVNVSLTDISGKGASAALHAGLVKYGIRAYATERHPPREVLRWLNRFYLENETFEHGDSFASVFFGRYDRTKRTLSYASAGHDDAVLLLPDGGAAPLAVSGPVVGVLADAPDLFSDAEVGIEPGSILLVISDGVTESRRDGTLFGIDRAIETAQRMRGRSLEDLACGITHEATEFAQRVIDDMAVLAIQFE